jgi:hypothetical protein
MQFMVGREDGKFKRGFAETTLAKAVPVGVKSSIPFDTDHGWRDFTGMFSHANDATL